MSKAYKREKIIFLAYKILKMYYFPAILFHYPHTFHNSCCFHYCILFFPQWAKVRYIKEMSSNRNGISSSQMHYATWLFFEWIIHFLQRTSIENKGGTKFQGSSNKEKIRSSETTKIVAIYFRWKKKKREQEKEKNYNCAWNFFFFVYF